MSHHNVQHWQAGRLDDAQLRAITDLHFQAFDPKGRTVEQYIDKLRPLWSDGAGPLADTAVMHVVLDGAGGSGGLVAKAATWVTTVRAGDRELAVLALAGVASSPEHRGTGLGAAVVQAAFARIGEAAPRCLYQTSFKVQPFYERLGTRRVENRFVDTTAADPDANPWTDDITMIYPADADWPDAATIDLRQPGW